MRTVRTERKTLIYRLNEEFEHSYKLVPIRDIGFLDSATQIRYGHENIGSSSLCQEETLENKRVEHFSLVSFELRALGIELE